MDIRYDEVDRDPILQCHIKKLPGRPKKKKEKKDQHENQNDPSKFRRFGLVMTCSHYLQTRHNKRGFLRIVQLATRLPKVCKLVISLVHGLGLKST